MNALRELLLDFFNRFITSTFVRNALVAVMMLILWLILGYIVSKGLKRLFKRLLHLNKKLPHQNKAFALLINSLVNVIFWFYIILMGFKELGIDLTPVIASAGVLAFAIGFGAQELIKDLISGFFLIIEQNIDLGQEIQVNGFRGIIVEIGLRRTKIVNWKNEYLYVNNGDVRQFISYNQASLAVIDALVDYQSDLSFFESDAFKAFAKVLQDDNTSILSEPAYNGVIDLNAKGLVIRITCMAKKGMQAAVERSIRRSLLDYFRSHENDLPVIRMVQKD